MKGGFDMATKKRYILTIEFNNAEDWCEFIEEKLSDESLEPVVVGYLELNDYFSDSDITCILEHTIGKS